MASLWSSEYGADPSPIIMRSDRKATSFFASTQYSVPVAPVLKGMARSTWGPATVLCAEAVSVLSHLAISHVTCLLRIVEITVEACSS